MSDKLFVVNKLASSLTLKGGYLDIEPYGYAPISSVDKTEHTVVYALGRNWIEITETEPKGKTVRSEVTATVTEPYKGMTEEELKASMKDAVETTGATGTALGQDTTVEVKPDAEAKETKKAKGK